MPAPTPNNRATGNKTGATPPIVPTQEEAAKPAKKPAVSSTSSTQRRVSPSTTVGGATAASRSKPVAVDRTVNRTETNHQPVPRDPPAARSGSRPRETNSGVSRSREPSVHIPGNNTESRRQNDRPHSPNDTRPPSRGGRVTGTSSQRGPNSGAGGAGSPSVPSGPSGPRGASGPGSGPGVVELWKLLSSKMP